jgi:hypothetical protein
MSGNVRYRTDPSFKTCLNRHQTMSDPCYLAVTAFLSVRGAFKSIFVC